MDKEICTIGIGDGFFDDSYTFYESGKIKRIYDRNMHKPNVEEWIKAKNISDYMKKKIIEKCDLDHISKITQLLK